MNKIVLPLLCFITIFFAACQNKSKQLLVKKWDCVKVENLDPVDKTFLTQEDSLITAKMEAALENLSWQFNDDDTYECSALGVVTVSGTFALSNDGKELICTTAKNNNNHYSIATLTEYELVLKGYTSSLPLVLHFKPH